MRPARARLPGPTRALVAILSVGVLASAEEEGRGSSFEPPGPEPSGDLVVETKSEMAAYGDTDGVSVYGPEVEGTIRSPTAGWSVGGTYVVDVVSAASVDIVSTATPSFSEVRHAATLSGTYLPGTTGGSVAGSISREPDYTSLSVGGSGILQLSGKSVNTSFGYRYSRDEAGLTGTPFSVYSLVLRRHSLNGSLELILNPETLITIVGDVAVERGRQEKPYRYLPLFAPDAVDDVPPGAGPGRVNHFRLPGRISERLPDSRNRYALTARVAQRLSGSTLAATERAYTDDWGVDASTTDVRFLIDMSKRVFAWTHLRVHLQSGATFYRRAYVAHLNAGGTMDVPALRSGDRELGPLLAGTFGGGVRWNVGAFPREDAWSLILQGDVATTHFSDALFIQNRQSFFGSVVLEARFE